MRKNQKIMLKSMQSTLHRYFQRLTAPPTFVEAEAAYSATLLTSILNLILVLLVIFAIVSVLTAHLIALAFVALATLLCVATHELLHRGHLQTARIVFVSAIWFLITIASLYFGGVNGPAFSAYLVLLLIIAMALTGQVQRWFFLLTLGSGLVIFALHCLHCLPVQTHPPMPLFDGVVRLSIMVFFALILYRISGRLLAALESARQNEQSARRLLDDLVQTSISEAYLDKILRELSDSLIVLGPDLRIERTNKATQTLLGYSEAELIHQPADEILTPNALHWLITTRVEAVSGVETEYLNREGVTIPVSFSGSVIHNDEGEILGIVCVAQDITDRQRNADELRQREELYRTLARNLPDMGALLYDHDLNVLIAEGSALIENQISANNSEGQPLQKIIPPEMVDRLTHICQQALAGDPVTYEWPYQSRTLLVHALPVQNVAEGIFGGLLLMQDITALKQVEANLVQHLENMTSLHHIDNLLSHKLDVPYVLETALETAVQSSAVQAGALLVYDEARQLSIQQQIGYCSAASDLPIIRQAVAASKTITRPNCYIIPLLSNDKPLGAIYLQSENAFGKEVLPFVESLAIRVATALDNARLYEISQGQLVELRQLYERLSHLEQLKTDMIRMAAHDLRSPLGIITGFSELLLETADLPPRAAEQAEHIHRAGDRMHQLITNILSLDRIEQLDNPAEYHKLELVDLVKVVFDDHRLLATERQLNLHLQTSRARIKADTPQIREAIANLLTNAIKYTPDNGEITVSLYVTDQDAIFEVTDNGYGIPPELQADIFKPFFRVQSAETRAIDGTGLGLHLVKSIIERHNGTLHFQSTYGQGSTFGFRLPLINADTDELVPVSAAG